ncbi:MAG: hypothetical protein M1381_04420 [Deltaproteobacteria bacterium]|nr:hypothetical protein [Deltaproteobacteria bacterium]MCL5791411.1 hypothetical protein [Deltaproteobacteria bacterium]
MKNKIALELMSAILFVAVCSGSKRTVVQGASPVVQSLSVQVLSSVPGGTHHKRIVDTTTLFMLY